MTSERRIQFLWNLLHDPSSSRLATLYFLFLLLTVAVSLGIFGIETMPSYMAYGESSYYCEKVVQAYCADKTNQTLDPGCYVYPTKYGASGAATTLSYFCSSSSCYGHCE